MESVFVDYSIFLYVGLSVILVCLMLAIYTIKAIKDLEKKTPICLEGSEDTYDKNSD